MSTKFKLKNGQLQATSTAGTAIAKFLCLSIIRFFVGRPMNGKKIDNSSFLTGATHGAPGKRLSKWQKKPQAHRAAIRACVFWPSVGLAVLAVWNVWAVLLALAFMAPFIGYLTYRKGRLIFFSPFSTTDVDSGVRSQHWVLRNRYRRLFRMQEVPGLITRRTRMDPDLPEELQDAIKKEIANNELKGVSPVFGKVTRYRRDRKAVTE